MTREQLPHLKKHYGRGHLRVVAYLGLERSNRRIDYGEMLVRKLISSSHTVAGLVIHPSDSLADLARRYSVPYISIPSELLQPADMIKKDLAGNQQFREFFDIWLNHIRSFNADIGVTVWAHWIPAELFSMPALGFINYHPAPLPQLRGMEPDTFAILEGRREIHGTVHKVNHGFDCGDIVAQTVKIQIHKYDTPVSVLENLNSEGIKTIIHTLNKISRGNVESAPQKDGEGTMATREMARRASFIDWDKDSVDIIDRKLRAFCGQDIGIRLKAVYSGEMHDIVDIEGFHGSFPGEPGTVLGLYSGRGFFNNQPIIRVKDGAVVVRLGNKLIPLPYSSIFYNECPQQRLIPAGKRPRSTRRAAVMRSIFSHR